MRYFVTGATGFVGSHVVDRLLERGELVRILTRQVDAAEKLRSRGAEVFVGDLANGVDLTAAVAGVDVVIHCAGFVDITASDQDVRKVNVEGTERLLAACEGQPLSRFVYLSSVAVYGHAPVPIVEDAPKQPGAAYGRSKWEAEQVVWRYHSQHGVPAVVLRPPVIYGPRDRKAWKVMMLMFDRRVLPLPGGGKRLLDLVYISDVVEAILAAATLPAAVGHAYNITDGQAHSYRDLLLAYEQVSGHRPTILPIPDLVFRLLQSLRLSGNWERIRGRALALNLDIHFAIDAARRDLHYAPEVSPAEGLRHTMMWSRAQAADTGRT